LWQIHPDQDPKRFHIFLLRLLPLPGSFLCAIKPEDLWGAVRKNIISDRFSTKTAISAHI